MGDYGSPQIMWEPQGKQPRLGTHSHLNAAPRAGDRGTEGPLVEWGEHDGQRVGAGKLVVPSQSFWATTSLVMPWIISSDSHLLASKPPYPTWGPMPAHVSRKSWALSAGLEFEP